MTVPQPRAAKYGKRVLVQGIHVDMAFAAIKRPIASTGIHVWQSTPMFSRDGRLLGILSVYFPEPHYPLYRELRMLDLYIPQAASLIERIRTEAALREHKELSTLVLNSITDGFMVMNADARFVYFNAAARSMLAEQKINADDLIGKQYLTEAFLEAHDDESGRAYRRAMSEQAMVEVENFFVPFNRWYSLRFFPMNANGMAIIVQDITERMRVEEALRESESRLRALAEASPGLIWQVDTKGSALYLNPRFRELVGVPLKDLVGTAWHSVIHPHDLGPYLAALDKAIRQRGGLRHRVRIKRRDGEWCWLETNALPWFTSEGDYAGHVGISIDISEAIETEK